MVKVKETLQSWLFWISHRLNLITVLMRLNKYLFNRVNNKECERGQRSVVWLKHGQPCLHHLHVLGTVFSWQPFSSFSLWIILLPPSLPPFNSSTVKSVWQVPGSIGGGLMAGGRGFASHGGVTLSRGWPCQRRKRLDIPSTNLHSATQLLNVINYYFEENNDKHTIEWNTVWHFSRKPRKINCRLVASEKTHSE